LDPGFRLVSMTNAPLSQAPAESTNTREFSRTE
jgi:hypothetical protein